MWLTGPAASGQKQSIPVTMEGAAGWPWPKAAASTEGLPVTFDFTRKARDAEGVM